MCCDNLGYCGTDLMNLTIDSIESVWEPSAQANWPWILNNADCQMTKCPTLDIKPVKEPVGHKQHEGFPCKQLMVF